MNTAIKDLETCARIIYRAALDGVEPDSLIKHTVTLAGDDLLIAGEKYDLTEAESIYIVAFGKAAPFMAKSLAGILRERLSGGIFLTLGPSDQKISGMTALPASHPLPDEKSLQAAQAIMQLAGGLGKEDLLFVLISGGGSAQLAFPAAGISLPEKRAVTARLLRAGAEIHELNTVRKHLSRIKGGRLAQAAYPARVISLVISDVIGNDLETIASGPTYEDASSFQDSRRILEKYGLWTDLPDSVKGVIQDGISGRLAETVRGGDRCLSRVSHHIIGDIHTALTFACSAAESLGFRPRILSSSDQGEAREAAARYVKRLFSPAEDTAREGASWCFLAGGELTVTVTGSGRGGRNQEFVLAAHMEVDKYRFPWRDWLILSMGTDGIDGPTDAAGAWLDPAVRDRIRGLGLDASAYLKDNDAYHFFQKAESLIFTGPTHTNVMDLRMFLLRP